MSCLSLKIYLWCSMTCMWGRNGMGLLYVSLLLPNQTYYWSSLTTCICTSFKNKYVSIYLFIGKDENQMLLSQWRVFNKANTNSKVMAVVVLTSTAVLSADWIQRQIPHVKGLLATLEIPVYRGGGKFLWKWLHNDKTRFTGLWELLHFLLELKVN